MLHRLLVKLDAYLRFDTASAHCDIPCKIYDPHTAQLAALSVLRFMDLIAELQADAKDPLSLSQQAQLIRLVNEKERHAARVKDEVRVIWGDYFKASQLQQFPDSHSLVHRIQLSASARKQGLERAQAEQLLALVNEFSASFWQSKGIETFEATCPYPPAAQVCYPRLG